MMQPRWTKQMTRATWAAALGLVVLATCAPGSARAADDEEDSIWNLDKRLFKSFMTGLGLKNPADQNGIDYHERSPLVVPPTRSLPPPQSTAVQPSPAWPTDPEVKRRADTAAKRRQAASANIEDMENAVAPSQLGPKGGGTGQTTNGSSTGHGVPGNMTPSELGYTGGIFGWRGWGPQRDEVGTFTSEPPRTSLTAPPRGYQTPSGTQAYGVTAPKGYGPHVKQDTAKGELGD